MKNLLIITLTILVLMPSDMMAQINVLGRVTDHNNQNLGRVTVTEVENPGNVRITQARGRYAITVGNNSSLRFELAGFITQIIPVNGQNELDVSLIPNAPAGPAPAPPVAAPPSTQSKTRISDDKP